MPGCLLCVVMNNVIFSGQHFLKVKFLVYTSVTGQDINSLQSRLEIGMAKKKDIFKKCDQISISDTN